MIKALVIDLDDTLLRTDKTVSGFTCGILEKSRAVGIKLVFATARPVRAIRQYICRIPCDAVICHNGAVTLPDGENVGSCYGVPIEEATRILRSMQDRYPHKKLSVEINDRIYANFDAASFWGVTSQDREMLLATTVQTDFSDLPDFDADKVLVEVDSEEEYREVLEMISPGLYGQLSDGGKLCQVMNKEATKLNAIRQIAGRWGVSISDIAAFGNDFNDMEMLIHCGVGIAVSNAIPEVRQAADVIAESNDDDGVARYILNHIL